MRRRATCAVLAEEKTTARSMLGRTPTTRCSLESIGAKKVAKICRERLARSGTSVASQMSHIVVSQLDLSQLKLNHVDFHRQNKSQGSCIIRSGCVGLILLCFQSFFDFD